MEVTKSMVVGSDGFIGKNLVENLKNRGDFVIKVNRKTSLNDIRLGLEIVDVIYYVAGNYEYDEHLDDVFALCKMYALVKCKARIVYCSSKHVFSNSKYGINKQNVERIFSNCIPAKKLRIERFTNVFGKWCKPNYNNFVSTFIHNTINGIESEVSNDIVSLIHIDDLVDVMIDNSDHKMWKGIVSDVMTMIESIHKGDRDLNSTFKKQIHSTYCSHLGDKLNGNVIVHSDHRGAFIPLYEYPDKTMISANIIEAGKTKGGHWHHTKIEEFTCLEGNLEIELIDIITKEKRVIQMTQYEKITIPPAHHHTINNCGESKGIFLIWTNELFDKQKPDTYGNY